MVTFKKDMLIQVYDKEGLVETCDQATFSSKYHLINTPYQFEEVSEFSNGYAWVKWNQHYGVIDEFGKMVLAPDYDAPIYFRDGLFMLIKDMEVAYVDRLGRIVLPFESADYAEDFIHGLAVFNRDEDWYLQNKLGDRVIYRDDLEFSEFSCLYDADEVAFEWQYYQSYQLKLQSLFHGGLNLIEFIDYLISEIQPFTEFPVDLELISDLYNILSQTTTSLEDCLINILEECCGEYQLGEDEEIVYCSKINYYSFFRFLETLKETAVSFFAYHYLDNLPEPDRKIWLSNQDGQVKFHLAFSAERCNPELLEYRDLNDMLFVKREQVETEEEEDYNQPLRYAICRNTDGSSIVNTKMVFEESDQRIHFYSHKSNNLLDDTYYVVRPLFTLEYIEDGVVNYLMFDSEEKRERECRKVQRKAQRRVQNMKEYKRRPKNR